ncbi:Fic family protein [Thiosulfatimonas sediminis]|uniref:Fic family protein n=1 Tax=Thiosulfatimonas sediminis TaxID=2675054 RepID=A0A6F8PTW8_9GAMM|nr:Fic family protein [Thiosulfatimonas sediminis]BBP45582.1 Fic family protein [Thiosulfatimonas sediminis]
MSASDKLEMYQPSFEDPVMGVILELNHLKRMQLAGTTHPMIFFQLKNIFHLMESVGSARIEGNRTTISEYVERKIDPTTPEEERFSEIANVEEAMNFIEEEITEGSEISHYFIRQLHQLAVGGLEREGDATPGAYRTWNVSIQQSEHEPHEHFLVPDLMEDLISFINRPDLEQYDLIKVAAVHHRFTWIHPFGNGNGRVVRLLTYAMLIKYGFNVKDGKLLNPTAVFCNDREVYYEMLSRADDGDLAAWVYYVLSGILVEVEKINRLLEHNILLEEVLKPTLQHAHERRVIDDREYKVLLTAVQLQQFKSGDLPSSLTPNQRTITIAKLKENNFIKPVREGGREYIINFLNNPLMRSLVITLEQQGFIPKTD